MQSSVLTSGMKKMWYTLDRCTSLGMMKWDGDHFCCMSMHPNSNDHCRMPISSWTYLTHSVFISALQSNSKRLLDCNGPSSTTVIMTFRYPSDKALRYLPSIIFDFAPRCISRCWILLPFRQESNCILFEVWDTWNATNTCSSHFIVSEAALFQNQSNPTIRICFCWLKLDVTQSFRQVSS